MKYKRNMLYTYVSITYSYFQGILYSFYFINCMETFLFLMCPSDYFDSTFFYHIANLCHPWTFMLSIRETTDTYVDGTDFFADQSVYLFQDSFVFYGFCRVGVFASIAGHHCCQTGIFRIILKEISSVLKCCQASDSGAYIIRMNTRQNSYFIHLFPPYIAGQSQKFS